MHFSTYTSFPAWQAKIVASACHCSGVATSTPWTSLSSNTVRMSCVVWGSLPCAFSKALADLAGPGRFQVTDKLELDVL